MVTICINHDGFDRTVINYPYLVDETLENLKVEIVHEKSTLSKQNSEKRGPIVEGCFY